MIVVNRSFVARYLDNEAVGQRIRPLRSQAQLFHQTDAAWEIVGIVEDMRQDGVDAPPQPEIFVSYRQVLGDSLRGFNPVLVVRTEADPAAHIATLRALVHEQDASLALDSVMTMDERVMTSLARPRTYALLLGGFAFFALAIAGVGLFGVLAYSVAQRAKEIGGRMALGARPGDIMTLVLRQGLVVTLAGVGIGLVGRVCAGPAGGGIVLRRHGAGRGEFRRRGGADRNRRPRGVPRACPPGGCHRSAQSAAYGVDQGARRRDETRGR